MSADDQTLLPDSNEALQIIERAESGDAKVLPALRELLEQVPAIRDCLGADLEGAVKKLITSSMAGEENLAFRESLDGKLEAMRKELAGPSPNPVEALLIDRVVACWLQVQEADLRYAQMGNCTIAQANFHLKRQDRAHRRFLSALKTLATVRKLALPTLQVNIAETQVNIASGDA